MGWGFQITKSYFVSDKYRSEVALKIDSVKDQDVRGGLMNPWNPPFLDTSLVQHFITRMSDNTRRFEVILTSFSSDKCNGRFKFKLSGCLYGQIRARAIKCSNEKYFYTN